jgi:hypothetical protein
LVHAKVQTRLICLSKTTTMSLAMPLTSTPYVPGWSETRAL